MRYRREEIHNMVKQYRDTKNRVLLDKIAKATEKIIYKFGKSFKGVPSSELNYIHGVSLMKALQHWEEDGRACFTSYLSTIIINELKMYMRNKQSRFEDEMLNEINNECCLANIVHAPDDVTILEYEYIVNDIISRFKKKSTQKALRMYIDGHKIEQIVNDLGIGRTNFFYDIKQFKSELREELENDKICI